MSVEGAGDFTEFVELEKFYRFYEPLSPYGQKSRASMKIHRDQGILEEHFRLLAAAAAFISAQPERADRVEFHLKRIPRMPSLDSLAFDSPDIFLVKKFLMNFKAVIDTLPPDLANALSMSFDSADLLKTFLTCGGEETFHISDACHPNLGPVREDIRKNDGLLKEARDHIIEEILAATGKDFRFRDFIITGDWSGIDLENGLIYAEPYDSGHVILKPVMPEKYYRMLPGREALVEKEKQIEKAVLAEFSAMIRLDAHKLGDYEGMVERADVFMARARLSFRFSMVRPEIGPPAGNISIKGGRYLPQEMKCGKLGIPYTPLTAGFNARVIVVRGSNMGGKTVLLKSLGFFQLLAQMGFFVPAQAFSTTVFDSLFYIGESRGDGIQGLSSFGLEIHKFVTSSGQRSAGTTLYLIDEFARTTGSREAEALIVAILHNLSGRDKTYCFLSTHFMELPPIDGVSFHRMKGLDHETFKKACGNEPGIGRPRFQSSLADCLVDRIRAINRFMQYEVIPDRESTVTSDALKIAGVLGLDSKILDTACEYLEEKWKRS